MHAHDLAVIGARQQDIAVEAPTQISDPQTETIHHDRQGLIQIRCPNADRGVGGSQRDHTVARELVRVSLLEQDRINA